MKLGEIKEFSIGKGLKYEKRVIKIDKSRNKPFSALSTKMNPEYVIDTVLLRVILEGEANLYQYQENELLRFYYRKNEGIIEPLDYKVYRKGANKVGENRRYRQQLSNDLDCGKSLRSDNVEYHAKDLIKYFKEYHDCISEEYVVFYPSKKRPKFNLGLKYELMLASTKLFYNDKLQAEFDNQLISYYGLSIEYVLPFRKNKWRILLEPSYYFFKEKTESENDLFLGEVELEYSSIELPLGVRYYMYLSNESKLFIDAVYLMDVFSKTKARYINADFIESKDVLGNFSFGIGYSYKRYSLEVRHKRKKNIADNSNAGWVGNHQGNSLILRVDIF